MTEAEWLAGTDARKMLEFVRQRASCRKQRLFACACMRRLDHLLVDERSRQAIEAAERYADEPNSRTLAAIRRAWSAAEYAYSEAWQWARGVTVFRVGRPMPHRFTDVELAAAFLATSVVAEDLNGMDTGWWSILERSTFNAASSLLARDILGDPFHPPAINPSWLVWNDACVLRLAQVTYEERQLPLGTLDNGRLAILADALEEAGCTNADILNHCRQPGEHVRGCWVIDLILGKE
jgi:hypothetical protein